MRPVEAAYFTVKREETRLVGNKARYSAGWFRRRMAQSFLNYMAKSYSTPSQLAAPLATGLPGYSTNVIAPSYVNTYGSSDSPFFQPGSAVWANG